MLTVSINKQDPNILDIRCPYYATPELKQSCSSANFERERKLWHIAKYDLNNLTNEFKGQLYFKTPLWVITNSPMPDMSKVYRIVNPITVPDLKLTLYDYQKFGVKFMIDRMLMFGFVINADGCGIGKTPQALATLEWFRLHKSAKKFLIVVKKSIKTQWKEEIEKFTGIKSTERFPVLCTPEKSKKKRLKVYEEVAEKNKGILITNYENFLNDTEDIQKIQFDFAIVDEAHCVKARKGVKNNNIGKVICNCPTVFLTGTPILSRPEDVYGIIQMAKPNYLGSWEEFKSRYLIFSSYMGREYVAGARNLDELRTRVQNVVIRRTEYEVEVHLPKCVEKNIVVDPDSTQESIFDKIFAKLEELREESEMISQQLIDGNLQSTKRQELLERKQQIENLQHGYKFCQRLTATDPATFSYSRSKMLKKFGDNIPAKYTMSSKTASMLDEIKEILDAGEKVIIFDQYVTVCNYIRDIIRKNLKVDVLMYTSEENDEIRLRNKHLFCESHKYNILIGSDAMAEGLNLAEARHIINMSLPSTYAIYTQRVGRSRRVSSKYDHVFVHNLLTKGSVDFSRLEKLAHDQDVDGAFIAVGKAQSEALKTAMRHSEMENERKRA